jgi:hypothetical protein
MEGRPLGAPSFCLELPEMPNRIQLTQPGWTTFTGVYAGIAFTAGVSDEAISEAKENFIAAQMSTVIYGGSTPAGEGGDATKRVSSNPTRDKTSTGSLTPWALPVKTVAGTAYTLTADDNGWILNCTNASAVTITVPKNLGAFACGIRQSGAGTVTISPAAGVTIENADNQFKTEKQKVMVSLTAPALDTFWLDGRTKA